MRDEKETLIPLGECKVSLPNLFSFDDGELFALVTNIEIAADSMFEMGDYSGQAYYLTLLKKLNQSKEK